MNDKALQEKPLEMPEQGFIPTNFQQLKAVAIILSKSNLVPEHLQGKVENCMLIVQQAVTWGHPVLAVAQASSVVRGRLCYEGKLISAVINQSGLIEGRLQYEFSGKGDDLTCSVSATIKGESSPSVLSTRLGSVKTEKNHLWKSDPGLQLSYRAVRNWCRLFLPEVITGIYSPEEIIEIPLKNITPSANVDEINADLENNGDNAIPIEHDMPDEEIKQKIQEAFLKHKADLEKKYIELSLPIPRNDKSWLNELDKYLAGFYEYKNIILFEDGFENFENGFSQWALSEYKN